MAVFRKDIKDIKDESWVSCPMCSCEISVLRGRLPREFSVLCPNCGSRKEYLLGELHDAKRDVETIHARAVQFGKMKMPIQSKSRLTKWSSWLLQ